MKYSEKILDLQKKYLNSLEKDVLLWLRNFFDALKKENEPHFSKIVVYVMLDPQSEGMSTYIESIIMFDEHNKNIRFPEDIRKKFIKTRRKTPKFIYGDIRRESWLQFS